MISMKKIIVIGCLFWSFFAWGEDFAPRQTGGAPLHVIFKEVTDYPTFRRFVVALQQTKQVDSFVMSKAKRGLIEYSGLFFGEESALLEALTQAAEGKFHIESRRHDTTLEITVAPL